MKRQWIWIQRDAMGIVRGVELESGRTPEALVERLRGLAAKGPIDRIWTNEVEIGSALRCRIVRGDDLNFA